MLLSTLFKYRLLHIFNLIYDLYLICNLQLLHENSEYDYYTRDYPF